MLPFFWLFWILLIFYCVKFGLFVICERLVTFYDLQIPIPCGR